VISILVSPGLARVSIARRIAEEPYRVRSPRVEIISTHWASAPYTRGRADPRWPGKSGSSPHAVWRSA
jgi:hypothetical protein